MNESAPKTTLARQRRLTRIQNRIDLEEFNKSVEACRAEHLAMRRCCANERKSGRLARIVETVVAIAGALLILLLLGLMIFNQAGT